MCQTTTTLSNLPLAPTEPPTRQELLLYYPSRYTWEQLKLCVNSGDLGTLRRDRALHERYEKWVEQTKKKHGSMENYLLNYRLQWGQVDNISNLKSSLDLSRFLSGSHNVASSQGDDNQLDPPYFSIKTPPELVSIIQNDWPVPVPLEVEHSLIWTKLPIYHPLLVDSKIQKRLQQDGMCGFTGTDGPPQVPDDFLSSLDAVSDWGITPESMIKSSPPTEEEARLLQKAAAPVQQFIKSLWIEDEWETAWFVNPPRLQSVPGLAHIHVFAKRK